MKRILTLCSVLFACATFAHAQTTATDFLVNDCDGKEHQLFAELNAGKVIVICWVMPCGLCITPGQNASAAVQSFAMSHPQRVKLYVVDDYANTSCGTVKTWSSQNNILGDAFFSDAKIKMTDYGTNGMPKTVVLGGHGHEVFFNTNGAAGLSDIQNAITAAIAVADVNDIPATQNLLKVTPNPAAQNASATLNFNLSNTCDASFSIQIFDLSGSLIKEIKPGPQNAGACALPLDLSGLAAGLYQIRILANAEVLNARLLIE